MTRPCLSLACGAAPLAFGSRPRLLAVRLSCYEYYSTDLFFCSENSEQCHQRTPPPMPHFCPFRKKTGELRSHIWGFRFCLLKQQNKSERFFYAFFLYDFSGPRPHFPSDNRASFFTAMYSGRTPRLDKHARPPEASRA